MESNELNQEVTSSRARFPKPVDIYEAVSIFGPNIVASEGDEWKKYRKISAPVFSDVRVNQLSSVNLKVTWICLA